MRRSRLVTAAVAILIVGGIAWWIALPAPRVVGNTLRERRTRGEARRRRQMAEARAPPGRRFSRSPPRQEPSDDEPPASGPESRGRIVRVLVVDEAGVPQADVPVALIDQDYSRSVERGTTGRDGIAKIIPPSTRQPASHLPDEPPPMQAAIALPVAPRVSNTFEPEGVEETLHQARPAPDLRRPRLAREGGRVAVRGSGHRQRRAHLRRARLGFASERDPQAGSGSHERESAFPPNRSRRGSRRPGAPEGSRAPHGQGDRSSPTCRGRADPGHAHVRRPGPDRHGEARDAGEGRDRECIHSRGPDRRIPGSPFWSKLGASRDRRRRALHPSLRHRRERSGLERAAGWRSRTPERVGSSWVRVRPGARRCAFRARPVPAGPSSATSSSPVRR